ncbi:hypothetical protein E6Q11_05785 [Candidatus Dojkabacteria bacterium]|uniref:Uncharacterized protein n=1 Tax=Candidatus Dojkabacteria bacterium TaxID=2099670 RepID=A0A5C7J603_9BACT|nr:MAG: hypothetical protein E6Q11_05785 [Candidatus Dojkabacteria bacterium]
MTFANRYAVLVLQSILAQASRWGFVVTVDTDDNTVLVNSTDAFHVSDICELHRKVTLFFDEPNKRWNTFESRAVITFDLDAGIQCIVRAVNQWDGGTDYARDLLGDARAIQRMIVAPLQLAQAA